MTGQRVAIAAALAAALAVIGVAIAAAPGAQSQSEAGGLTAVTLAPGTPSSTSPAGTARTLVAVAVPAGPVPSAPSGAPAVVQRPSAPAETQPVPAPVRAPQPSLSTTPAPPATRPASCSVTASGSLNTDNSGQTDRTMHVTASTPPHHAGKITDTFNGTTKVVAYLDSSSSGTTSLSYAASGGTHGSGTVTASGQGWSCSTGYTV